MNTIRVVTEIQKPSPYDIASVYKIAKKLGESQSYHGKVKKGIHRVSDEKYDQIMATAVEISKG